MFILSPLLAGAALVWTALCGCALLSGPHSLHKLLCSRSWGAARRVQGEAGGAEARAAWWAGRASTCLEPGLSGTQIGESASSGKIQAHPRPLVNNGSGPFHCPERRSFHLTNGFAPWTVARQALLSMEFSRQEYWDGMPFSPPGDLPDPGWF